MAATKTPSYRGSTKHGGGPSAQAEEINEIPDPEARPEEQLSRCLRLPRGQSSPPQSSKTNSRVPPRIRNNLTELKNPLEMSVQTSDFWERSGQSLEALLGPGPQATGCHSTSRDCSPQLKKTLGLGRDMDTHCLLLCAQCQI